VDKIQIKIEKTDNHLCIPPFSHFVALTIDGKNSNKAIPLTSKYAAGKDCLATLDNTANVQDNTRTSKSSFFK